MGAMAETLKSRFGAEVPRRIAAMIVAVHPDFPARRFVADALRGYEPLELLARGAAIAAALRRHLPAPYPEALRILVASFGPPLAATGGHGMAPFLYLPHGIFIAEHGLDHPEASLAAQRELTRRFTAEFAIRPFLRRHPDLTLATLRRWTGDPDPHVRRLVSEGTRPRLPWASRLPQFQRDPAPVLALLERLRDDPEPYVRRSVANNLNDIGKDHPGLLVDVARDWMRDAGPERSRLVRHALRSLVKAGDPGALEVLGYGGSARPLALEAIRIAPARPAIGGEVTFAFTLAHRGRKACDVVVDLRVFYVKARGHATPKVYKLRALRLAGGESAGFSKTLGLADRTTRRHHPGVHRVEVLLNGEARPLGEFRLRPPQ